MALNAIDLMKHFLPYIFILGFLSCNKSEEFFFPELGNYSPSSISNISHLKMYTVNKEIDNQDFIKGYLERRGIDKVFSFEFSEPISEEIMRTHISILSDTSAIVHNYNGMDTMYSRIERKNSRELVIKPYEYYTSILMRRSRCDSLTRIIQAYPSIQDCKNGPSGGEVCGVFPQFPIGINDGKFYIPLLNFSLYHQSRYVYCGVNYRNNWNFLAKDFLQQLKEGDTIVVQTKNLFLSR